MSRTISQTSTDNSSKQNGFVANQFNLVCYFEVLSLMYRSFKDKRAFGSGGLTSSSGVWNSFWLI